LRIPPSQTIQCVAIALPGTVIAFESVAEGLSLPGETETSRAPSGSPPHPTTVSESTRTHTIERDIAGFSRNPDSADLQDDYPESIRLLSSRMGGRLPAFAAGVRS
jgi:hypothetical protein